jgi:hypothetical protein
LLSRQPHPLHGDIQVIRHAVHNLFGLVVLSCLCCVVQWEGFCRTLAAAAGAKELLPPQRTAEDVPFNIIPLASLCEGEEQVRMLVWMQAGVLLQHMLKALQGGTTIATVPCSSVADSQCH